jgi:hypothetical protein
VASVARRGVSEVTWTFRSWRRRSGRHPAGLIAVAGLCLAALTQPASAGDFTFTTSADFVRDCDGSSPPEACLNAIMEVEQVIDSGENPNATCDGGTDALLKSASSTELNDKLAERLARVVPWLKAHQAYDDKSYGDGVWAALRGAYCP